MKQPTKSTEEEKESEPRPRLSRREETGILLDQIAVQEDRLRIARARERMLGRIGVIRQQRLFALMALLVAGAFLLGALL